MATLAGDAIHRETAGGEEDSTREGKSRRPGDHQGETNADYEEVNGTEDFGRPTEERADENVQPDHPREIGVEDVAVGDPPVQEIAGGEVVQRNVGPQGHAEDEWDGKQEQTGEQKERSREEQRTHGQARWAAIVRRRPSAKEIVGS